MATKKQNLMKKKEDEIEKKRKVNLASPAAKPAAQTSTAKTSQQKATTQLKKENSQSGTVNNGTVKTGTNLAASTTTKPAAQTATDQKLWAAYHTRQAEIQRELPQTTADLRNRLNQEISKYTSVKGSYGNYAETVKSQTESRANLSKLRSEIEGLGIHMGKDGADMLKMLDEIENGYDRYRTMSAYNSEAEYNQAMAAYEKEAAMRQKYAGKSNQELEKELRRLVPGSEEYNWVQDYSRSADVMTAEDYARLLREAEAKRTGWQQLLQRKYPYQWQDENNTEEIRTGRQRIDELTDEIESLKRGQWEQAQGAKYGSLRQNRDYRANSQAQDTGAVFGVRFGNTFVGTGDPIHDYINGKHRGEKKENIDLTLEKYDYMTSEERADYNYLYNTQGKKAANDYLDYLSYSLNLRRMNENVQRTAEYTSRGAKEAALMSAASVGENLAGGVMGLADLAKQNIQRAVTGTYRPIDYNSMALTPQVMASTIRGTVSQNIADATGTISINEQEHPILARTLNGKNLGELYQLGMSMADSAAIAAMAPVIGKWGTVLLGGSAGTQGVLDAVEAGATDTQAIWMGLMNGAFETLFEEVSLENLLTGDPSNIARLILKQGFIEGSEEVNTTIANNIANLVIMGAKSDHSKSISKYMAQGMSYEEAEKQAILDEAIGIGWDFVGGAITGGIMGGLAGPIRNQQTRSIYNTDLQALIDEAVELNPDNQLARDMQARLNSGKRTRAGDVAKLISQNDQTINNLEERAETSPTQTELTFERYRELLGDQAIERMNQPSADTRNAIYYAQRGTEDQIRGSFEALRDTNGLSGTDKATRYGQLLDRAAIKRAQGLKSPESVLESRETSNTGDKPETPQEAAERLTGAENTETGEETEDIISSTGERAEIKGVYEITDKGMTVETESGDIVNAADVSFGTAERQELYETVERIAGDAETANTIISGWDGKKLEKYLRGVRLAEQYGRMNIGLDVLTRESKTAAALPENVRRAAYNAGQKAAGIAVEQAEAEVKGKLTGGTRTGSIKGFDGSESVELGQWLAGKNLSERQTVSLQALEALAPALGVEFNLYESYEKDGKRVFQIGGEEKSAPNGWYKDGKIYIDLNAGLDAGGTILFTASHELTHFIKDWSPAKFKTLADVLIAEYGEKGVSVGRLVRDQQAKAKRTGRDISYEEAYEEMIADSMETMLTSDNVLQTVAAIREADESLWQKIKDWFADFIETIKGVIDTYKGAKPDSPEGRLVSQMRESLAKIESLWSDALIEASDRYMASDVFTAPIEENKNLIAVHNLSEANLLKDLELGGFPMPSIAITKNGLHENYGDISVLFFKDTIIPSDTNRVYEADAYTPRVPKNSEGLGADQITAQMRKTENRRRVKEYTSLDEIKSHANEIGYNAREMLLSQEPEEWQANESRIMYILSAVTNNMNDFDTSDRVRQFASDSKSEKEFKTWFKATIDQQSKIPDKQISEIYNLSQWLKKYEAEGEEGRTTYFEAKPQRVVGLNEIAGVVIPANSSEKLKNALKEFDFKTVEYKAGDQRDRVDKIAEFEDVRFSERDNQTETEAFKRWFGDSKVVDEDGKPKKFYHGTNAEFSVFDLGKSGLNYPNISEGFFFFTDKEKAYPNSASDYARHVTSKNGGTERIAEVFLKIENPLELSARGYYDPVAYFDANADGIYERYFNGTYDGVLISDGDSTIALVDRSEQIKSATDNVGTFDPENPDIRFSERDELAKEVRNVVREQDASLEEDAKRLEELLKLQKKSGGTKITETSVRAVAKRLLEAAGASGGVTELTKQLNKVYQDMAKLEDVSAQVIKEWASPAVDILMDATRLDTGDFAELKKELRKTRISLTEAQKGEAAYAVGSYGAYRQQLMGSVILTDKDAVPLELKWAELSERYPALFPADTSEGDMPRVLAEVIGRLRINREVNATNMIDLAMAEQEYFQQIYEGFWQVSTLQKGVKGQTAKLKSQHMEAMKDLRAKHKQELSELKAKYRQSITEVKEKERAKAKAETERIRSQYAENRDRALERREITRLREDTRKKLKRLDTLVRKEGKTGIKEEMKDFAKTGYRIFDELMKPAASAESVIESMSERSLESEKEKTALREAKELISLIRAGDTDPKLRNRLEYRKGILRDAIEAERVAKDKAKVKDAMDILLTDYENLQNSNKAYIREAFDQDAYDYMRAISKEVVNVPINEMTWQQHEQVNKVVTMVLHAITTANELFDQQINATVAERAEESMRNLDKAADEEKRHGKGTTIKKIAVNNFKPYYFFKWLGDPVLQKSYENVSKGEETWATDIDEANDFRRRQEKKYGFDKWDMDKQYEFTDKQGRKITLNLGEIMSMYAYSKRDAARNHIGISGFVYDSDAVEIRKDKFGIKHKRKRLSAKAHSISAETWSKMINTLTRDQIAYVDAMQDYLSKDMAQKGNDVSMQLHGVKIFGEDNYFPMRSSGAYLARANEANFRAENGMQTIKNQGFTKSLTPEANNPLVLIDFTNLWSQHVNEMSQYHGLALPLEDMRKILNYGGYSETNAEGEYTKDVNSVRAAIIDAYGPEAAAYIDQLYRDINGGVVADAREGALAKGISAFKGAAVMASLSVTIQQPSAIGRAMAYIDPKYFIGPKPTGRGFAKTWETMNKYAPVTIIKDMGFFDVGMGRSAVEYLTSKEYKGFDKVKGFIKDAGYRSEAFGKLPGLADQVTWIAIWNAVAREQKALNPGMDVNSEAFLQKVGRRFTDVIKRTQVYDSVMSRSANMRSKGAFAQLVTAFMAEPTTSINMMQDAIQEGRRGNKRFAARQIGAVYTSIILNSALAAIVYAMRKKDDDKTYLEKYVGSFTGELLESMNPLTYYPLLKDIWSIFQGYDVERSDMSLWSGLAKALNKVRQHYGKDISGYDDEAMTEWHKEGADAWLGAMDYITAFAGIPVKNIRRDVMGVINTVKTVYKDNTERDTTFMSLMDTVEEELINGIPFMKANKKKADKLYEAIMEGDDEYSRRLEETYSSETAYHSALKDALRQNDGRIKLAAKARFEGDTAKYEKIARELVNEGNFSQDDIVKAINAEINTMKEKKEAGDPKAVGLFNTDDLAADIARNGGKLAETISQDIIETAVRNGKTEEKAKESLQSGIKSKLKEMYINEEIDKKLTIDALKKYAGQDAEKAAQDVTQWTAERETGIAYGDIKESYLNGDITAAEAEKMLVKYGGKEQKDAAIIVKIYDWQGAGYDVDTSSTSVITDYEDYCKPANISRDVYWDVYQYYKQSGQPGVSYSKTIDTMEYLKSVSLTPEQKYAICRCWWVDSTINKYKTW